MRVHILIMFVLPGVIFAGQPFQEIVFQSSSTFIYTTENGEVGNTIKSVASKVLLEMFDAKPVKGKSYINGIPLQGWLLNTEETVYEVVQFFRRNDGSFWISPLTCLVHENGEPIQSTVWKEDQTPNYAEIWRFYDFKTKTFLNQGILVQRDPKGDWGKEINAKQKFKGNKKSIQAFIQKMFELCGNDMHITDVYEIEFGYFFRGNYKKVNQFKRKVNQIMVEMRDDK